MFKRVAAVRIPWNTWLWLLPALSVVIGSSVAFFLWALDQVTRVRFGYPWLLYLLPLAGIGIHFLYARAGKNAERGNNLIIDEIHDPGEGVPGRMAPLVLVTTLVTHLFGGSAGREGTAVQMGGSLADLSARHFMTDAQGRKMLLLIGIAAGFGAVFGTPVTGALFAIEVLLVGQLQWRAFLPCFLASVLANITVERWGVHHIHYVVAKTGEGIFAPLKGKWLLWALLTGVAFGIAARFFVLLTENIKAITLRWIKPRWCIPVLGALIVITMTLVIGTDDYLGLGVLPAQAGAVTLPSAFTMNGTHTWSWLLKLVFTAVTIGTGFKGGEVTPLFFIGATLGNVLAMAGGLPIDLFAALGFIAVFAGATNTPLACTIMSVELFGPHYVLYFALACLVAFCCSGKKGIYPAQRRKDQTG